MFDWLFKTKMTPEMEKMLNLLFWHPFQPNEKTIERTDYNQITAEKIGWRNKNE